MTHTQRGESQISSYLSQSLSQKIGRPIELKIEEIALSFSHVGVLCVVDDKIRVEADVSGSLFGDYDIVYHLLGVGSEKIDVKGTFKGKEQDFYLTGAGSAFEGEGNFSWHHLVDKEEDIRVDIRHVDSAKVALLLGVNPLVAGKVSLQGIVPLWSAFDKQGEVHVHLDRGGVYLRNIEEQFALRLPEDLMLAGDGNITLLGAKHHFEATARSNLGLLQISHGDFIEVNAKAQASYRLEIEELARWKTMTKKRYSGAFSTSGTLHYHEGALAFKGSSSSLGGQVDYAYAKGKIDAKIKEASLQSLFTIFAYPPLMDGAIHGEASYTFADKIAVINLGSKEAYFNNASFIGKIAATSGVNLAKERFSNVKFSSSVQDSIVRYTFIARSQNGFLELSDAKMDAVKNSIEAKFDLDLQEQKFTGEIYGSLQNPKVKLDMAKYIEFKAKKEFDNFFGSGSSKKLKDTLKGFF